jgi:ubiquinol-cytochrome c reductase cytochrome c subunit
LKHAPAAFVLLAVAVLALLVSGPPPASSGMVGRDAGPVPQTQQQVSDADLIAEGRRLYLQSCASCHGPTGAGTSVAPSLENAGPATNDFYLRTGRMPLGRLGTPSWEQEPQLSDELIEALVAYTSTLGEGPEIPQVVADTGDLQRGWELYINNCAACHGATGAGGGIGAGVIAPGLSRADPLIVGEAMLVGPGAMPRFDFPEEDVNAVAAYVQYLHSEPSPGGIPVAGGGPVPEGLVAGVVGVGLLVLVVRWIARRAEFEPGRTPGERQR